MSNNTPEFDAGMTAAYLRATKALEEVMSAMPEGADAKVCMLVAQHKIASLANGTSE